MPCVHIWVSSAEENGNHWVAGGSVGSDQPEKGWVMISKSSVEQQVYLTAGTFVKP